MRIARVRIRNFRGIKTCDLLLPAHAVLIGDNNVGKSTVLEAIDLCMGPDRLGRQPPVDEHDFFLGEYLKPEAAAAAPGAEPAVEGPAPQIEVEVTVTDLTEDQQDHFGDHLEFWDNTLAELYAGDADNLDEANVKPAIRVTFLGQYDEDEDDFTGRTVFARSLVEDERPAPFTKRDKHICGFLYLRTLRTGSRALSLEHGSLLDLILRLKELRPRMWEETIDQLRQLDVAADPALGLSGILESVNKSLKKYVPRDWGSDPHLRVSNLTREHLRKVITAFIATGNGEHAAPYYRQGTGTINMLVLALLSQIAEDKQNVIFAMEEVEIAIPPYAQKRIVNELHQLSAQSLVTSHSPYVLEEFEIDQTLILSRSPEGTLVKATVTLPDGVKLKRYRQEFRQRFCEGLLASRILVVEGATEASAYTAVARRLAELEPTSYASLENLGICVIDAGGETAVASLAKLYRELGKRTFAACDKQSAADKALIEAEVDALYMHEEHGLEDLVLAQTAAATLQRFAALVTWPPHLVAKHGDPVAHAAAALPDLFAWNKGGWSLADFLAQCTIAEVPQFLREACANLKELCEPARTDDDVAAEGKVDAA